MAKLMFYPIGNADTTLIHLNDERMVLVDYCNMPLEKGDKRVDLQEEIRSYLQLQSSNNIDLVAFTHADDDHVHGVEDLFWFNYAEKYQSNDRIKIKTLAVPACFLLETGLKGSARIIHDEARYRLKEGKEIVIFGNPGILDDWLKVEGISPKSREECIVHAGSLIPSFDKKHGEVEFFVHSPFSFQMEDEDAPRNSNCLILHATFLEGQREMRLMLGADGGWEDWTNVVYASKKHGNEVRLKWDVFHISHHCSYLAISPDKGKEKTKPEPALKELFDLGGKNSILISPSDTIPSMDTDQPPHRQAATYYQEVATDKGAKDNFLVTMEWPTSDKPKSIIIESTNNGFMVRKSTSIVGGAAAVMERPSHRLG
jgi:hypothetical protein